MARLLVGCLVVAAFAGCDPRAQADSLQGCPVIAGAFQADYTLLDTVGNCGAAKPTSSDPMTFVDGSFVSPVVGLVNCATVQADCQVAVACTTPVLAARMDFSGELSPDGAALTGTATLKGTYQGCSRVRYDVSALRAGVTPPTPE